MESKLKVSLLIWLRLIWQLRKRGSGKRESGAFLLAKQGSDKVVDFVCFDDLDPSSLDEGYIIFSSKGFVRLWEYCRKASLYVVADVHTHPSLWTGQSELDRTNPMISRKGHIALIVPFFAQKFPQLLKGVGVYEYCGGYKWINRSNESSTFKIDLL